MLSSSQSSFSQSSSSHYSSNSPTILFNCYKFYDLLSYSLLSTEKDIHNNYIPLKKPITLLELIFENTISHYYDYDVYIYNDNNKSKYRFIEFAITKDNVFTMWNPILTVGYNTIVIYLKNYEKKYYKQITLKLIVSF